MTQPIDDYRGWVMEVRKRRDRAVTWRSPAFQTVLVLTLILSLGVPLLSPLLPPFGTAFGVGGVEASYLLSASFLPGIVLSPFIGRLLDTVGRRQVLVVNLLEFGGIGLAMRAATSFPVVIAARLI